MPYHSTRLRGQAARPCLLKTRATAPAGDLCHIAKPAPCPRDALALYLDASLRSYKAQTVSEFVAHVLSLQIENSRSAMAFCPEFPIVMSRDFATAQELLKRRQRGSRRIGLIASSGGRRRAHGLEVRPELDVEDWFLNATSDVRSSYYLDQKALKALKSG
jgi:hypothetical protein